jgi:hypothetical protein
MGEADCQDICPFARTHSSLAAAAGTGTCVNVLSGKLLFTAASEEVVDSVACAGCCWCVDLQLNPTVKLLYVTPEQLVKSK